MTIKLGQKVRDKVTEFEGKVTGICEYIGGHTICEVSPKTGQPRWVEITQLEVVNDCEN